MSGPGSRSDPPTRRARTTTKIPALPPREPVDPLDVAPSLEGGLFPGELDELVAGFAAAHGVAVRLEDAAGRAVAQAGGELSTPAARGAVLAGGEPVGVVLAAGARAEVAAAHLANVLGMLLHHAHARRLTTALHDHAAHAAHDELTAKNRRLLVAVDRLGEVDRIKSNFLATISHELRTPLTSVIGYAEMLLEGMAGPVAAQQREFLTTILGKADQLLGLISSVIDVAQQDGGRGPAEPEAVALDALVDGVVASFAPQAQKRGVSISVRTEPLAALGERRLIRQVVWQLVSNAVKFTPENGWVEIEVTAPGDAPGERRRGVCVVVRDSGIGIPVEQLPHIFEPFFQGDSSSTRAFGGAGLGLSLAKAYVESQGGRLWVDSAPGRGSTFTVSLPRAG